MIDSFMEQYLLFYSVNSLTYLGAYMGRASASDLVASGGALDVGDSIN